MNFDDLILEDYQLFSFKDFSQLDQSKDISYLIQSMQSMLEIEGVRHAKEKAIALLKPLPGESIIELGCGLGYDAKHLAEKVSPNGKITAVDSSIQMIKAAKNLQIGANIEFMHNEIKKLSFLNSSFDAAYADRVLVSQKQFSNVFLNITQLLKPNGRICITDLDYSTIIIKPYDHKITNAIKTRLHEITENPNIGQKLEELFKSQNLQNIQVMISPYTINKLNLFNSAIVDLFRIINDLLFLRHITSKEADLYKKQIVMADSHNQFSYTVNLYTVYGVLNNGY